MPKDFVTLLQGKQKLSNYLLYESLVGQFEYTKQLKDSFWCYFVDTKDTVVLIFINKLILALIMFIVLYF